MIRNLFAVSAGLLVLAMSFFFWPLNVSAGKQQIETDSVGADIGKAYAAPPLTDFETISNRPLFAKERRKGSAPSVESQQTKATVQVRPPTAILVGVMEVDGRKRALVATKAGDSGHWRSEGDRIESWTISEIDPNTVKLEAGEQKMELHLYDQENFAETPVPANRPAK